MNISLFKDIIRIPEREKNEEFLIDKNNQINYWKIYENSYVNNFNINNIGINSANVSIYDIQDFIEYINNIKYNIYKMKSETFQQHILLKFLLKLNVDDIDNINIIITEVFNLEKKNINILKLYFNCIEIILADNYDKDHCDILLLQICNVINNIIINTDVNNPAVLIKLDIQIDKFIDIVPNCLREYIFNNILSSSFQMKLKENLILNFTKTIKVILKSDSIYKKTIIASFCNEELLNLYFDNINKIYTLEDYSNSKLAYNLLNIFKLVNKIKHNDIDDDHVTTSFSNTEVKNYYNIVTVRYNEFINKNNNIINYLCASIYDFMINDINNAIELIRFQKFNNNLVDFIVIYKQYLQKRCINKFFLEKEQKLFTELKKSFDNKTNKMLEIILNCIDDLHISDHINKEIKNLDITVKNPMFKNIPYYKNKLNISVLSNLLWADIIFDKYSYNPNIPLDVKIYSQIIEKYYNQKYDNRVMNMSHDNSNIVIKIKNLTIKLPLVYYYILKFIANNDSKNKYLEICPDEIQSCGCTSIVVPIKDVDNRITYNKFISCELKIPEDYVKDITDILLDKKIIITQILMSSSSIDDTEFFIFNEDICYEKNKINLTKLININKDKMIEEIEYDKVNLIDCYLIKIVKKENISFPKLIFLLRKQLSKFFVPNDTMINERLKRMIHLEYISFDENDKKYMYKP